MSSSIRPTTIALAAVGALATGLVGKTVPLDLYYLRASFAPERVYLLTLCNDVAYAVYFDHKRRTDPEFRKALKRESRRIAKAAKEEAEAQGAQQRKAIRQAVSEAQEEGFPTSVEEKEAFFMSMVGQGEALCQGGKLDPLSERYCADSSIRVYTNRGSSILLQSAQGVPTAR